MKSNEQKIIEIEDKLKQTETKLEESQAELEESKQKLILAENQKKQAAELAEQ